MEKIKTGLYAYVTNGLAHFERAVYTDGERLFFIYQGDAHFIYRNERGGLKAGLFTSVKLKMREVDAE